MVASYLFDPSKGETPKSIAQQRQLATLLASRILGRAPKNVGEGLNSLGQALIARTMLNDANSAQKAGLASANSAFSSIASMLAGGSPAAASASPAAPFTPSIPTEALSGAPVSETASPLSGGMLASTSPAAPPPGVNVPEQYKPLVQGAAQKYGIPEDVLTRQLNTESRFNPTAVSPAGATGIAQFMPETAKDMGVNPADPSSAIPGAARYVAQNRDRYGGNMTLALAAYNWGPGNVDKWLASGADPSKMPAETRKYVETILGPDALSRPVQVASNDPNFAPMSPAPMAQAAGGNALAFNGQPQNASPLSTLPPAAGPQGFAPAGGPAPNITTIPVRPTQLPIGGQTAQAAPQPAAPQAQPGPSMEVLLKAASNPFLSAGQRAVIGQMVKQRLETQQQSNDPLRQLQIQQARKNLTKQEPPKVIETYDEQGRPQKQIWNAQSGRYEPIGGSKAPNGMQLHVGQNGEVTFQQGAGIKPFTESQSKDVGFITRMAGALPTIDSYGNALTSLREKVGGSVPLVGNYMKSDDFQKAEQAGEEFVLSILRKDSGAAVPPEEREQYGRVYLPQPGDSDAVLQQKRAARHRAMQGVKLGLPPSAILQLETGGVDLSGAKSGTKNPMPSRQDIEQEMRRRGLSK